MKKLFSEIPCIAGSRLILKKVEAEDKDALDELRHDPEVYRLLPTFLFEQQYDDIDYVIGHLYDEAWKKSIILGIYEENAFCGLAEFYGYRPAVHKISIGYRLLKRCWGRGIATETVKMMADYLFGETDIRIISASTLPENKASAAVLRKNGFLNYVSGAPEDWGYGRPLATDKWVRAENLSRLADAIADLRQNIRGGVFKAHHLLKNSEGSEI